MDKENKKQLYKIFSDVGNQLFVINDSKELDSRDSFKIKIRDDQLDIPIPMKVSYPINKNPHQKQWKCNRCFKNNFMNVSRCRHCNKLYTINNNDGILVEHRGPLNFMTALNGYTRIGINWLRKEDESVNESFMLYGFYNIDEKNINLKFKQIIFMI